MEVELDRIPKPVLFEWRTVREIPELNESAGNGECFRSDRVPGIVGSRSFCDSVKLVNDMGISELDGADSGGGTDSAMCNITE